MSQTFTASNVRWVVQKPQDAVVIDIGHPVYTLYRTDTEEFFGADSESMEFVWTESPSIFYDNEKLQHAADILERFREQGDFDDVATSANPDTDSVVAVPVDIWAAPQSDGLINIYVEPRFIGAFPFNEFGQ